MNLPSDGRGERDLWIQVITTALLDATAKSGKRVASASAASIRHQADTWLRYDPDMLAVAALAGLDGQAIRQRYVAGLIGRVVAQRRATTNHAERSHSEDQVNGSGGHKPPVTLPR